MKVTFEQVQENVVREEILKVPGTNAVIVALVCKNGYVATGFNNCVDDSEYNFEFGCEAARGLAYSEVWRQLGYELRTKLMEAKNGNQSRDV